jgi:clusterin-associated protein 1
MKESEKIESWIARNVENKTINFDIASNLEKLKRARALGSEITQRGVLLYDMLSKEVSLREARHSVLVKAFELEEVERLIRSAIQSSQAENTKFVSMIATVEGNINNLDIKIEKKKQEIERSEKRFQTLKKVRPAFMDEYERLQEELNTAYKRYVNRFRCLSFLQKQMEELNRMEIERKAEERSLRQEGDDYFFMDKNSRGDMFGSGSDDDDSQMNEAFNKAHAQKHGNASRNSSIRDSMRSRGPTKSVRPQATAGSRNRTSMGRSRQVYGSMLGGGDDSGESESDLILVDGEGDNSDLGSDDPDDDDDLELQDTAIRMARSMGVPTHIQDHIMRQEMKHANNIMHGVEVPPAPSVSAVPSSANINMHHNQHLAGPQHTKSSSAVPNGGLRNH